MTTYLYLLRHTESIENTASKARDAVEGYDYLKSYLKEAFSDPELESKIRYGAWPSQEAVSIAKEVRRVVDSITGNIPNSAYDLLKEWLRLPGLENAYRNSCQKLMWSFLLHIYEPCVPGIC